MSGTDNSYWQAGNDTSNEAWLREMATLAKEKTYSPYSKFPVGAAIATADGRMFLGTNVENASYGLTVCAERVAAFAAVAAGATRFVRVAVTTNNPAGGAPCGACRQVLYEFGGPELDVECFGTESGTVVKLKELLPNAFGPEHLLEVAGYGHGV